MTRLLEQVDLSGDGQIGKAALAASQLDWVELQQHHSNRWRELVRHTFGSLDADRDGLIRAKDIVEVRRSGGTRGDYLIQYAASVNGHYLWHCCSDIFIVFRQALSSKLPESELQGAVHQAMVEAGRGPGDEETIDFEGFLSLLKVGHRKSAGGSYNL